MKSKYKSDERSAQFRMQQNIHNLQLYADGALHYVHRAIASQHDYAGADSYTFFEHININMKSRINWIIKCIIKLL